MTSAGGTVGGGNVAWYSFDEADGTRGDGFVRQATVTAPSSRRRTAAGIPGFCPRIPETQFMRLEEFATYGGNQGIWAPYYTLHKILAGLLDAHTHDRQHAGARRRVEDRRLGAQPARRSSAAEQFDRMWNMYIAGEYGGANDAFASLHAIDPTSRSTSRSRATSTTAT